MQMKLWEVHIAPLFMQWKEVTVPSWQKVEMLKKLMAKL